MNEVMRNAKTFLGLLQTAKTDAAAHWNQQAFQRAMQWAQYFEGVYKKLEAKSEVVTKFGRGLEIINSQPGASPGPNPITFADLKHSRRLLLKILLQNPYLSSELYSLVLDHYQDLPSSNSDGLSGPDQLNQDTTECAYAKAQREAHLRIKALTSAAVAQRNGSFLDHVKNVEDVELQANASILFHHLLHHLTSNPTSQSTRDYLHDKLEEIAGKPNGLEIISLAASHPHPSDVKEKSVGHESSSGFSTEVRCKQFLGDWLEERGPSVTSSVNMDHERKPP